MILKNEVSKALDGTFRAAYMLTGCTQAAEHAVLDGIAATEFDNVKCYEQGAVLGLNQSLQSVAQILAPLASTFLIGHRLLAPWAWFPAAICMLGLWLCVRMPREAPAQMS